MEILNNAQQFENAVYKKNYILVEEIISSSDYKKGLIQDYLIHNHLNTIKDLLPLFRSKGLIQNLENIFYELEIIKENQIQINRLRSFNES